MTTIQEQVEIAAQKLAAEYKSMRCHGLIGSKKHSIHEISTKILEARKPFPAPYDEQMLKRFRELVGLDGDPGLAFDQILHRDFPG